MKYIINNPSPSREKVLLWFLKFAHIDYIYEEDPIPNPHDGDSLKEFANNIEGSSATRLFNTLIVTVPRFNSITIGEFVSKYSWADLLAKRGCGVGSLKLLQDNLKQLGYDWK